MCSKKLKTIMLDDNSADEDLLVSINTARTNLRFSLHFQCSYFVLMMENGSKYSW